MIKEIPLDVEASNKDMGQDKDGIPPDHQPLISCPAAKASDMIAKVKTSIQGKEGIPPFHHRSHHFIIGYISVIATVGHTSPESFDATGDTANSRLNNFKSRDLAHTAWAFSTTGHAPLEHFYETAETNTNRLKNLNSQHLAQTVWAISTIGHTALELFDVTAVTTFGRIRNFVSQDYAHTVWAISTIDHTSLEPLYAIAESPICRVKHFNVQDLAHTAWAISTIGHAPSELFDAPAETAICCVRNFNSQALAHTVWATSMTGHTSVEFFAAIAEAAIGCLKPFILKTSRTQYELCIARTCRMHLQNDFNSQLLAIPAWAFCEFGLDKKGIPATWRLQIFLKTLMSITIIIDVEATPVYMCEGMQIIVKTKIQDKEGISRRSLLAIWLLRICESMQIYVKAYSWRMATLSDVFCHRHLKDMNAIRMPPA